MVQGHLVAAIRKFDLREQVSDLFGVIPRKVGVDPEPLQVAQLNPLGPLHKAREHKVNQQGASPSNIVLFAPSECLSQIIWDKDGTCMFEQLAIFQMVWHKDGTCMSEQFRFLLVSTNLSKPGCKGSAINLIR